MFLLFCVAIASNCAYHIYSLEQQEDFKMWEMYDDSEESFCETDGKFEKYICISK